MLCIDPELLPATKFPDRLQISFVEQYLKGGAKRSHFNWTPKRWPNAILKVDAEGTFHLRWVPGLSVSAADADPVVAAVRGVSGGRLQPMLVEVVDVFMSLESRLTLQGARFVSALALVGATGRSGDGRGPVA